MEPVSCGLVAIAAPRLSAAPDPACFFPPRAPTKACTALQLATLLLTLVHEADVLSLPDLALQSLW